ncbi:MAG: YbaK/EbsC family protein [Actinobacteria bacterium]|nr:YbaK/EbsC family protein [Actinomycetota bacterium]NCV43687.1 YbaK/EbsC family protein [Actinomycetota bacterium]NCV83171.1 YbaK/EbsC family protein [Actinomycetota bacterium]NCV95778.1 YbaK/EbsC family protein [Actinomycetota bacterium]NCW46771.1 YbaK/EbsC family protein [Actinomycetota bacterium]
MSGEIKVLSDSARTAQDAATALGIQVGQIASSIVFKLPSGNPLLIVTSGRHRVNTDLVSRDLGVEGLGRADADYVKNVSGYSVGGVAPVGWLNAPEIILIDRALGEYEEVWAAAGHPHTVFPTSFDELLRVTGGTDAVVGD